jgi:hypothetical protein
VAILAHGVLEGINVNATNLQGISSDYREGQIDSYKYPLQKIWFSPHAAIADMRRSGSRCTTTTSAPQSGTVCRAPCPGWYRSSNTVRISGDFPQAALFPPPSSWSVSQQKPLDANDSIQSATKRT